MNECRHESELVDSIGKGQWPDAAGEELRSHVAGCAECSEIALTVSALVADRLEAEKAPVPSSGAMWWRMGIRLQQDARVATARRFQRAQMAVVGITFAVVILGLAVTSILQNGWAMVSDAVGSGSLTSLFGSVSPLLLLVALVPLAIFGPVAVWLAIAKE
jgi:hypothetical protein